jgi:hypothetical protein
MSDQIERKTEALRKKIRVEDDEKGADSFLESSYKNSKGKKHPLSAPTTIAKRHKRRQDVFVSDRMSVPLDFNELDKVRLEVLVGQLCLMNVI